MLEPNYPDYNERVFFFNNFIKFLIVLLTILTKQFSTDEEQTSWDRPAA